MLEERSDVHGRLRRDALRLVPPIGRDVHEDLRVRVREHGPRLVAREDEAQPVRAARSAVMIARLDEIHRDEHAEEAVGTRVRDSRLEAYHVADGHWLEEGRVVQPDGRKRRAAHVVPTEVRAKSLEVRAHVADVAAHAPSGEVREVVRGGCDEAAEGLAVVVTLLGVDHSRQRVLRKGGSVGKLR